MHRLRGPFIARAVSHCQDYLKVKWADGVVSSYPSTFLRANVRDTTFWDENSMLHNHKHHSFIQNCVPITQAEHLDSNEVKISWEDHSSSFDATWLRAQDEDNLPSLLNKTERLPWGSNFQPNEYDFSEAKPKLDSWMKDVDKHGCVLFHNVPTNLEGFRSVVNLIAPPSQRRHPTDEFHLRFNAKSISVDVASYSATSLLPHTDHSYYAEPAQCLALLAAECYAPQKDTDSLLINSFQVAEQLREEDPESFELLSTIKIRRGRRRLTVEEECDPSEVFKYEWDHILDSPMINVENGQIKTIRLHYAKEYSSPLNENKDERRMKKFYQAKAKFLQIINNPQNQVNFVLRQGMMLIFDNHKLLHGRGQIYPDTKRYLIGGFISSDSWTSRRRLLLGKKTGLADKWLLGCSENALMALAERFEENSIGADRQHEAYN